MLLYVYEYMRYAVSNVGLNRNRWHVPSPPRSGEKVAEGRMGADRFIIK